MMIEFALTAFGPLTIAAGRITIASFLMLSLIRIRGHRMPLDRHTWKIFLLAGLTGSTVPFTLISWAQISIDSSLAAIIMAFTPITTLILAHVMTHDEKLSLRKTLGMAAGFAGVILLLGGVETGTLTGQATGVGAVLLAGLGYAFATITMRRLSHLPPAVATGGVMSVSATFTLPLAFLLETPWTAVPTADALLAVLYLGAVSSALAALVMMRLVFRTGATFLSINNYFVPAVGTALGVMVLDEHLTLTMIAGFALILAGVALATFRLRKFRREPRQSGTDTKR